MRVENGFNFCGDPPKKNNLKVGNSGLHITLLCLVPPKFGLQNIRCLQAGNCVHMVRNPCCDSQGNLQSPPARSNGQITYHKRVDWEVILRVLLKIAVHCQFDLSFFTFFAEKDFERNHGYHMRFHYSCP